MSEPVGSFILPVLDEASLIEAQLREMRARFPHYELIVVDGGSTDDTVVRAMPLCDQLLLGERGRALQMNLGALAARGHYLFFLHADTTVDIDEAALSRHLADQPEWGFFRLRLSGARLAFRVIEWFINKRSRLTSVATGDQLLYLQRDLYQRIGGFDPIPLMEDVALCKRLRRLSAPAIVSQAVTTASRRWEKHGVVRTVLTMWALRLAYYLGASPQRLGRYYYGG